MNPQQRIPIKHTPVRYLASAALVVGLAVSAFAQAAKPKVLGRLMKTQSEAELKAEITKAFSG